MAKFVGVKAMHENPLLFLVLACVLGGLTPAARPAAAEPKKHATSTEVQALAARLASSGDDELPELIERLSQSGRPEAARALEALVFAGQRDEITEQAVDALGRLRSQEGYGALAELARHRRPEVRLRAQRALAELLGHEPRALIAHGLGDPDARVRANAAKLLGELGAHEQLDRLFVALSRGVPEAAVSIGSIASSSEVARLHAFLGKERLSVLLLGYEPLLLRPDIDEATKLDVIAKLEDLAGEEVRTFLRALLGHPKFVAPLAVKRAVAATLSRLSPRMPGAGEAGRAP